jgi:hypothetical protein
MMTCTMGLAVGNKEDTCSPLTLAPMRRGVRRFLLRSGGLTNRAHGNRYHGSSLRGWGGGRLQGVLQHPGGQGVD